MALLDTNFFAGFNFKQFVDSAETMYHVNVLIFCPKYTVTLVMF